MTRATINLGGTASDVVVGKVAVSSSRLFNLTTISLLSASATAWSHVDDASNKDHSSWLACLMSKASCRWKPDPVPDEQCFEAIKAGVDALPPGAKMFLNGGEQKYCQHARLSFPF